VAVKTLQVGHIGQIHHQVWQARNHWSLCPLTLRGPGLRLVQTRETAFPPIDEALKLRVLDLAGCLKQLGGRFLCAFLSHSSSRWHRWA